MNTVKIKSYAKINLTLEIVGVENGYHMLDSLVASIDLYDSIHLKKRKDSQNRVIMRGMGSESILPEHNNAQKAADAFASCFGTNGADITVYKNIPIGAGLGGSSADVVGVLNGMAALYGIQDRDKLKALADRLGSDTGYMLDGGFARMQGRGEKVTKLGGDMKLYVLLICPPTSVSTVECYREYDKLNAYMPPTNLKNNTENCIKAWMEKDANGIGRYVMNDLYAPSVRLNQDVLTAFEEGESFSPLGVVMTGSGSGVAVLFETKELCQWAKSRYKGKFDVYETATVIPDYSAVKKGLGWRNPFVLSEEEISNASGER